MSATRSGRQLRLRRADRCRACGADLAVGAEAWWDPAARTVTCLACVDADVAVESDEGILEPIDAGRAGASALREYQRRHDAREQHARAKLGGLGDLLAKVIDEPASTRVWQQGANGEVRVAERLEKHLNGTGVRLLHDRRVPGHGRANIDHLAVGPGGVTVIDSKTHRGKIRSDWYGGVFVERRTILRIDGRDQTKLITGVERQIGYVRSAFAKLDLGHELDVAGALCFPHVDGLPWLRRIEIRGILVDGPEAGLTARRPVRTTRLRDRRAAQDASRPRVSRRLTASSLTRSGISSTIAQTIAPSPMRSREPLPSQTQKRSPGVMLAIRTKLNSAMRCQDACSRANAGPAEE